MMNMNTNANTDKIIDFLNDLTNKVGEGKHITLLAEKQDWFDAKRTLAQERLYGWDEGDVIVDNDGNIFTFDDDNSWHVEHLSEEEWRKAEVEDQIEQMTGSHWLGLSGPYGLREGVLWQHGGLSERSLR